MLLRRSMALRQVMDRSQVRNCASPRNVPSLRNAVTNASCATSSASTGDPTHARAARKTARRFRSTSSPNASRSPAWARRTSSRSVASRGTVAVTRSLDSATSGPVGIKRAQSVRFRTVPHKILMMLNHEQLLKLIREKLAHPATPRELLQALKLPRDERPTFKRLLADLVESGELVETRGNRFGLPDKMNLIVGKMVINPRGFGFLVPDRPMDNVHGDLYSAGNNLNQAMHGDRVVARLERIADNRAEG